VRIVCIGDIHLAFRAIDRLAPELHSADLTILTGDLTHFGEPPEAFRVVDAVRRHCPNVLAVTGNLDFVRGTNSAERRGRTRTTLGLEPSSRMRRVRGGSDAVVAGR
jgi:predicted phosphodiesterase